MKAALVDNAQRGEGRREFSRTIDAAFDRAGLTRLAPYKVQNIYQTNVSLAFGAGQMQKMLDVADDFPFWKFSATLDSRTRPGHAALHGKIFRAGDYTFFPPLTFGCRCTAIPLTARQAGRYPAIDLVTPDGKQQLYNSLESKEFAGNKQEKFVAWVMEQYKDADPHTRGLIDQAVDIMKDEIHTLKTAATLTDKVKEQAAAYTLTTVQTALIRHEVGQEASRSALAFVSAATAAIRSGKRYSRPLTRLLEEISGDPRLTFIP